MLKKNFIFIGLLMVTVFLIAAPASAQKVRGVTDTEILIGQWGPQTGPAAPWGAVARGTDLLVKIINEEGGIHGRKIQIFSSRRLLSASQNKSHCQGVCRTDRRICRSRRCRGCDWG